MVLPRYSGADGEKYAIALSLKHNKDLLHWRPFAATRSQLIAVWSDPANLARKKEGAGGVLAGRLRKAPSASCADPDCEHFHKNKLAVVYRSIVTLDADIDEGVEGEDQFLDRVRAMGWLGFVHTSFNHRQPGKGLRYRLYVFVSRAMLPDECVALWIQARIGQRYFDSSSHQFVRTMYRPSAKDPDAFEFHEMAGDLVDVDTAVLDAPPPPKPSRRRASGDVAPVPYEAKDYADLEDWQQAQADADVQRALSWAQDAMEAYLADEGDPPFKTRGDGWDEQFTGLAYFLGCLAVCPWSSFSVDDAKEFYWSLLPHDEANEARFRDKIEYDNLWSKVVNEPVDLPPWERPAADDPWASVTPLDGGDAGTLEEPPRQATPGERETLRRLNRAVMSKPVYERAGMLRWALRKARHEEIPAAAIREAFAATRAIIEGDQK